MKYGYTRVCDVARAIAVADPGKVAESYYNPMTRGQGFRYLDPEGCPSCYVGRILADLGFDVAEIRALDAEHNNLGCAPECQGLYVKHVNGGTFWENNFTQQARKFLRSLQAKQDDGLEWGDCYRQTWREMNRRGNGS